MNKKQIRPRPHPSWLHRGFGHLQDNRGSGTVTVIGLVAAIAVVAVAVGAWVQVSTARAQAQTAAESAVLATATRLNLGQIQAGSACADLATQAAKLSATVTDCQLIDWDVRAHFTRPATILGVNFKFRAKARAGPEETSQ